MSDTTPLAGRRRIRAPAAGVLALLGAVTLVLGLRGTAGPPQPPTETVAARAAGQGEPDAGLPGPTAGLPGPTAGLPGPTAGLPGPTAGLPDPTAGLPDPTAAPAQGPAPDFGPILPASAPVGIRIPAIDVDTTALVPLTVGADGVLPAPTDFATVGWHTAGPNPGQLGPAVMAGHVDGPDGPAVFYRLGELTAGDEVSITREDGTVATFAIDSVASYAKDAFPTSEVYGNTTGRAEIRLITCGGAFDATTGHYVDNIVVFGHLTG